MKSCIQTVGYYQLDDVLDVVLNPEIIMAKKRVPFTGFDGTQYLVDPTSQRYQLFAWSRTCYGCGLEGTYCLLQRQTNHPAFVAHFNLFGTEHETGNAIMLTKDHITPKANAGKDVSSNYQTLCAICNTIKGSHMDVPYTILREAHGVYKAEGMVDAILYIQDWSDKVRTLQESRCI